MTVIVAWPSVSAKRVTLDFPEAATSTILESLLTKFIPPALLLLGLTTNVFLVTPTVILGTSEITEATGANVVVGVNATTGSVVMSAAFRAAAWAA